MFEHGVLETDWGAALLKDCVKIRAFIDHVKHGDSYSDWLDKLFSAFGAPQYVAVNAHGEVTGYLGDVFLCIDPQGKPTPQGRKAFEAFVTTMTSPGKPFDFEKGWTEQAKSRTIWRDGKQE